jgi:hypothetical protein
VFITGAIDKKMGSKDADVVEEEVDVHYAG